MTQTGELKKEALFKQLSLKELSIAASDMSTTLLKTTNDEEFLKVCQEYIAKATADKVDGYSFVAWELEADITEWQERKSKLLELSDEIITRKQQQLELLKASLLKMHQLGIISNKLEGKTRSIAIQPSPPKITQLHIQPDSPDFPEEFRQVRVEYKVDAKALIERWKAGDDVSAIADIEQGHHVRFRHRRIH